MPQAPVTYPGGGQRITVDAALKQPRIISRRLTDLTAKRFVADKIFSQGSPEQVAGGAAVYQRSEPIYPDRAVEEVGVRAEYPRTGWTEELFAAFVKKYGLEAPVSDEARRRNQIDQLTKAQLKIANAVVKFVDALAMTLILTDADVLTGAASGDWSTAATDIIADIATARKAIFDQDEGYEPDTLVVNPAQEFDLLLDKDIRDALPRESRDTAIQGGKPVPILGLKQILVTSQLTAGTAIVLSSNIIGTIADERPLSDEKYVVYNPPGAPANYPTIYTKTYREENKDETIIRGARFPAMWLGEPKSARLITGA
jgi:hypothetical protein